MGRQEPGVAIILLNWNGYKDTFECLKSLETLDYSNFAIYVVDNYSSDGSYEKLLEDDRKGVFKKPVYFIQSGANLGFAGGNNVGIRQALEDGYEYIWMLNNDTIVDSASLSELMKVITKNEDIGIVGSKIYYYGTNKIWFAGGKVNYLTGTSRHIGMMEEDRHQFDSVAEVDYITGCSLLFRKELIKDIGYMREDYFLYYEETDWNIKAQQKGWKVVFVPSSIVYHKVSVSSGGPENLAPYVDYYDMRNGFVMIWRNFGMINKFISFLNLFWKCAKKLVRIVIKNQNNKRLRMKYIFRGMKDALTFKMGKHPDLLA